MRRRRSRRVSATVSLLNGIWVLIRGTLDVIGYSTAPEDAWAIPAKVRPVLDFIAQQPYWLAFGVPLVIAAVAAYFWLRPDNDDEGGQHVSSHNQQGGITAFNVNTAHDAKDDVENDQEAR